MEEPTFLVGSTSQGCSDLKSVVVEGAIPQFMHE
jgi:hypothetical protein